MTEGEMCKQRETYYYSGSESNDVFFEKMVATSY